MRFAETLTACVLILAGNAASAFTPTPSLPSVPGLLTMLETARYADIPRGKTGAMSLAAVIRGFSDSGCQFDSGGPKGNLQEVQRLTESLNREMGGDGVMSLMFVRTFPNYADTLRLVAEANCASPRVQKTMRNLMTHLRARFDPNAPMRPARPASPAPSPATPPVSEADAERIQRNGCEAARKRLAEMQARDRGDARSARMVARYEERTNRVFAGL